jgi:hypothetical protein
MLVALALASISTCTELESLHFFKETSVVPTVTVVARGVNEARGTSDSQDAITDTSAAFHVSIVFLPGFQKGRHILQYFKIL